MHKSISYVEFHQVTTSCFHFKIGKPICPCMALNRASAYELLLNIKYYSLICVWSVLTIVSLQVEINIPRLILLLMKLVIIPLPN